MICGISYSTCNKIQTSGSYRRCKNCCLCAVYERINYVAESRGFNILELNGELDHIHLLIEADPQTSPSELVNVIKTQTSRKARKLYGDTLLKKYYWKPYFWSDSYFIATVSENTLDVVKNYIKNQGIK